ncbi:MAG: hypothetical protein O7G28_02955 [Deltaproteobacteria bacterium]|nr:hypothetical protein [Deltaproteobacteria bacterium]
METSIYRSIFGLAARVGSLEGYLYVGKDVEVQYLPGWLENINRNFSALTLDVRREISEDYLEILMKIADYLERLYGKTDQNARTARGIVAAFKESAG